MEPKYIIVQAGGRGTRLGRLTANKPKALVPVKNRPMLFHLFQQFPKARFVVIADYKADVMRRYLAAFAEVQYLVVESRGATGTCSGLAAALHKVPAQQPFLLIWCDLVLPEGFSLPCEKADYIGLSKGFLCRWRYVQDRFEEIPSSDFGVAGLFWFQDKASLAGVPEGGEFVKWLQRQGRIFHTLPLLQTEEYGLLSRFTNKKGAEPQFQCRPFNTIRVCEDGKLVKTGIDEQGRALAVREVAWYKHVSALGFKYTPQIYCYEPLTMDCIDGRNVFAYQFSHAQRLHVLKKLIACLRELHALESVPADAFSIQDAYLGKTWGRLNKIRDLVPFADRRQITINGKVCRNIFFYRQELEEKFSDYRCERFVLLHGDNTFSNILLDSALTPIFIDPRGYFGHTELYGDPVYDWAKLYYSIVGNYDQFNKKRFKLEIREEDIALHIESNGWEDMEDNFFSLLSDEVNRNTIRLLHAMIWLSLTTYAWEDYDSVCGAFYNGLYYLEDVL